jgi:uncharacterized membrane-anchored protein YhcB (DUF1043 family)
MDPLLTSPVVWFAVLAALAVGFAIGRGSSATARQAQALERELRAERGAHEKTRDASATYKQQVSDHFSETSERLHDLTLQYRSVYEHLAKGANELCPEGFAKLEGGLGLDALPEETEARAKAESPPQT